MAKNIIYNTVLDFIIQYMHMYNIYCRRSKKTSTSSDMEAVKIKT